MKLYKRDFTELNPEELAEWNSIKEREIAQKSGKFVFHKSSFYDYSKAVRHYDSFFPNNYLDTADLKEKGKLLEIVALFRDTLNSSEVTVS